MACYFDHYKSGGFAVRCGGTRDNYRKFGFRVLMVFKTAERRNNAAERFLQELPTLRTMPWLATFADVVADPLGPIWIRPSEYRDATKGTLFEPERQINSFGYRRNAERESFIESKIKKLRLLEG